MDACSCRVLTTSDHVGLLFARGPYRGNQFSTCKRCQSSRSMLAWNRRTDHVRRCEYKESAARTRSILLASFSAWRGWFRHPRNHHMYLKLIIDDVPSRSFSAADDKASSSEALQMSLREAHRSMWYMHHQNYSIIGGHPRYQLRRRSTSLPSLAWRLVSAGTPTRFDRR